MALCEICGNQIDIKDHWEVKALHIKDGKPIECIHNRYCQRCIEALKVRGYIPVRFDV